MGRRPWFPFYVQDWEGDETVKLLDNRSRGVYLRLLCHQWREGSLPASAEDLAVISGETLKAFAAIWPRLASRFPENGSGRRSNPRMAKEIARADDLSRKRSAAARQKDS